MGGALGPAALSIAVVVVSVLAMLVLPRLAGAGRADFEVRLGPGDRVEVRGRVPRSKVPGIRAFFRSQPGGVPVGRIRGRFGPGGTPRLEFAGRLDPATRQRARNYLIEHLR